MEESKPISADDELAKRRQEINMMFANAAYNSVANKDRWVVQFNKYKNDDDPFASIVQCLCDIHYQLALVAQGSTEKLLSPEQFKQANDHARNTVLVTLCSHSEENPVEKMKKLFDGIEIDQWVEDARAKVAEKDAAKLNDNIQNGIDSLKDQSK